MSPRWFSRSDSALAWPHRWQPGRLIRSVLFRIATTDPVSIVFATATLVIVALVAAYLPARRASRVEPLSALRYEQ
jgi:hypothetical protein